MPEKKEIDDNDEEAIDAETYKQREFDDFKDSNPRGWGTQTSFLKLRFYSLAWIIKIYENIFVV